MKVSLSNGTLTVVSDISKEVVEKGYTSLKVTDEKKGDIYAVSVDKTGKASIAKNFFTGNTYIDGKLAAVIQYPLNTKEEEIKKMLADGLLALQKYGAQIADESAAKAQAVEELFNN